MENRKRLVESTSGVECPWRAVNLRVHSSILSSSWIEANPAEDTEVDIWETASHGEDPLWTEPSGGICVADFNNQAGNEKQ